ncbi:MAG: 3,5-cyclic-AMP phosphodiesterase [Actinomycetota bacterium]|jgi:predicted phosphodiesterase|nr:3,5-cyclic-AMP phosphodiesterase [Actinomycetota bacterium]
MNPDLAADLEQDLLRSSWIIERARSRVYERWGAEEDRFSASAQRAARRARSVQRVLDAAGRRPDEALVEPHVLWIQSVIGARPGQVAFGDFFLARLGDWVQAHAGELLDDSATFVRLGEEETAALRFPEEMSAPPPFEPVTPPVLAPPGDVRFRFAILGDLHMGSADHDVMASEAVDDLNASGADLVIQLGDITDHGNRDEFENAARLLGRLEMPCTTMMGNHDVFSFQEERLAGQELYRETFRRGPDGVLFNHKGVRFAVLDSAEHAVSPFPSFDLLTGKFLEEPGGAIPRGSLTPVQHDILAEVAAPDSGPAFVFLHHPPQPFTAFPPVLFGLRDQDSGRLHATVDSGNVWGVFAGHTHRNARTRTYDREVPAQEVAIPRDYPFGYALVDVTESGYLYRFIQISNRDLLVAAYGRTGEIQRRYSRGTDEDLAFVWHRGKP